MRVNVYAEELTDRIEIITKKIGDQEFTALRFYLALPASVHRNLDGSLHPATVTDKDQALNVKAPFIHHPGDDDSAAVTFWGKRDLRVLLREALAQLDAHYASRNVDAVRDTLGTGEH